MIMHDTRYWMLDSSDDNNENKYRNNITINDNPMTMTAWEMIQNQLTRLKDSVDAHGNATTFQ